MHTKNHLEKGFYYHYKHDDAKGIRNFAYELLGTAWSTESGGNTHTDNPEDFLKDEAAIYRPLYEESLVYKNGRCFWIRPLGMFMEEVTKDGKIFPRFAKITDPEIIKELEKIRDEMYS